MTGVVVGAMPIAIMPVLFLVVLELHYSHVEKYDLCNILNLLCNSMSWLAIYICK